MQAPILLVLSAGNAAESKDALSINVWKILGGRLSVLMKQLQYIDTSHACLCMATEAQA